MKSNKLAIEAIRKQIQVIAFDANLFDLGIITDNPYQQRCSKKRKELNAELIKLGGIPKSLPFSEIRNKSHSEETEKQLSFL